MITLEKRPETLDPAQTKEWSAAAVVNTIIALMVVAALGGILYCINYLQTPPPLRSQERTTIGATARKAEASGSSSNLPLPMPLPFPMPLQLPAPVVDRGVGNSNHLDGGAARVVDSSRF